MLGHRLNPTIHRYEEVELIEVHSEYLECSFMVAKDEWETGKKLLIIFSPIDGNVLGFPHYRLHRDNISATGPKLPDGTTAQPGMAEAIEMQRQAGHAIYADHLSAMLYGNGLNPGTILVMAGHPVGIRTDGKVLAYDLADGTWSERRPLPKPV